MKGKKTKKSSNAAPKYKKIRFQMDVAAYAFGILAFAFGAVAALCGVIHYRDTSLWTTCFAIVFVVIGGFCWLQDREWKKDSLPAQPTVSEKRDQRARVVVDSTACEPLIPEVGQPLRVVVKFFNRGKTPAKNVTMIAIFEPVDKGAKPDFSYLNDPKAKVGVMAPNVEHISTMVVTRSKSTGEERTLTPELFEQLKNGDIQLFAHGRADYDDVFRDHHWLTFCASLNAPFDSHFSLYSEHNDTDD